MNQTDSKLNTFLFQSHIDQRLVKLLSDFSVDEIRLIIEETAKPGFGQNGLYSFFCQECNGRWYFPTKEVKAFYEKFHRAAGCSLMHKPHKMDEPKRKVTIWVKSPEFIPQNAVESINKIIAFKMPHENPVEEKDKIEEAHVIEETTSDAETNMRKEPEAVGS